jgi:hypothetical protein
MEFFVGFNNPDIFKGTHDNKTAKEMIWFIQ